jgi:hypothetical protein
MNDVTAIPTSKACSKCGVVKPLDAFTFDKRHRDGRQARCRTCHAAYQKEYRERDREHYLELRQREWAKPETKAKAKAWSEANRERIAEQRREWLGSLPAERLEALKAQHRKRSTAYRLQNPELCNERIRDWKQRNPDKPSSYLNVRRARKRDSGEIDRFERSEIGERDGWVCGICHEPIDPTLCFPNQQSPSLDHIVPLALGGTHTRANSRITHWICNVRRGIGRYEDPGQSTQPSSTPQPQSARGSLLPEENACP